MVWGGRRGDPQNPDHGVQYRGSSAASWPACWRASEGFTRHALFGEQQPSIPVITSNVYSSLVSHTYNMLEDTVQIKQNARHIQIPGMSAATTRHQHAGDITCMRSFPLMIQTVRNTRVITGCRSIWRARWKERNHTKMIKKKCKIKVVSRWQTLPFLCTDTVLSLFINYLCHLDIACTNRLPEILKGKLLIIEMTGLRSSY